MPILEWGCTKLKIWKKSCLQTGYENVLSLEWVWCLTKNLPSGIISAILYFNVMIFVQNSTELLLRTPTEVKKTTFHFFRNMLWQYPSRFGLNKFYFYNSFLTSVTSLLDASITGIRKWCHANNSTILNLKVEKPFLTNKGEERGRVKLGYYGFFMDDRKYTACIWTN